MKKFKPMLLLLLPVIICCTNKSLKNQEAQENQEILISDALKTNVDNFLEGKLYFFGFFGDNNNYKIYNVKGGEIYIHFVDSLHFRKGSYKNRPYCGNEFSSKLFGRYYLPASDELVIIPDSTTSNYSLGSIKYENEEKLVYKIIRTKNDSIIELIQLSEGNDLFKY